MLPAAWFRMRDRGTHALGRRGPWWESDVKAGSPLDPFLLTGFERKMLHSSTDKAVMIDIGIDLGGGKSRFRNRLLMRAAHYYNCRGISEP